MSFRNRLLPRERRRQPRVETNERSSTRDHSRRLRSLPHNFDYLSIANGVEKFVDWIDRGIIMSLDTLENLLGNEPSPTLQGSTSQTSNNNAVETPIDTNPQRSCTTTAEESTQDSFKILDYMERFVDYIDVGINGILNTCVNLEHDFQGSTSQVSDHSVVEIPTATILQEPCMTTVEEVQETVTPTLETPVEIPPEIYESFVSEMYESCFVEHTDVAHSTIAEEIVGEAPLCNVAASEELTPPRDDVVKNDDDDEWIVVEDES